MILQEVDTGCWSTPRLTLFAEQRDIFISISMGACLANSPHYNDTYMPTFLSFSDEEIRSDTGRISLVVEEEGKEQCRGANLMFTYCSSNTQRLCSNEGVSYTMPPVYHTNVHDHEV